MSKPKAASAHSVHDRLLTLAHQQGEDFQVLLTRYCLERLLYRVSRSVHRDLFVLKGAFLFALWSNERHRPTRDLDLLGRGACSVARFEQLFRDICSQPVEDDGLLFRPDTVHGQQIRADEEYKGVRILVEARLGTARLMLQTDIGFGDAITPAAVAVTYPTLLDLPAPSVLAYPRETVVAEKFQAMVLLGLANSRTKDFFDVWVLARKFPFDGPLLCQALQATFQRRQTPLPEQPPLALTELFAAEESKRKQWQAFLRKGRLEGSGAGLEDVIPVLHAFLMPPAQALARGEPFPRAWPLSGPWTAQ